MVIQRLREDGHEVYDFKNPAPGNTGFAWSELDPDWLNWTPEQFIEHLEDPIARDGFKLDFEAMQGADVCVLLLPCGRSAHLEAGWFIGKGRFVAVLLDTVGFEPELMYKLAEFVTADIEDLLLWLEDFEAYHS